MILLKKLLLKIKIKPIKFKTRRKWKNKAKQYDDFQDYNKNAQNEDNYDNYVVVGKSKAEREKENKTYQSKPNPKKQENIVKTAVNKPLISTTIKENNVEKTINNKNEENLGNIPLTNSNVSDLKTTNNSKLEKDKNNNLKKRD